ncbi:TetR/AcrR family transcriptional regulator [Roseomonas eburnea]|uniref:TetR/AcrR family transcriptional regulator n=1 Tax=Neoroseomonas eburnea TaxID=1346889 RepID=A0A9X9XIP6_9PROT|nr:TetR family transcriptional regulator [Neoroseomonas eburnea]MBR0683582.1 TetR/AcrR family transcriptional regulator [Neoroseomonas eburnea]
MEREHHRHAAPPDDTTPSGRESYRHGNLPAAATQAALELVVAEGHEKLSLRAVAQKVGVAHRSLYNHFADRQALLDAVAEQGYLRLAAGLESAATRGEFIAAYVRFAVDNPALYWLMKSRPHATMKRRPGLQRAAQFGITVGLRLFGDPAASPAANRRAVMKVLILLHGGISLHLGGILDVPGDEGLIAELQAMIATDAA